LWHENSLLFYLSVHKRSKVDVLADAGKNQSPVTTSSIADKNLSAIKHKVLTEKTGKMSMMPEILYQVLNRH
jgi:hypothetical protein